MSAKQSLLREIETFLRTTGMKESAFGHKTNKDGKLLDRLREGGTVTLETAERIRKFIADNQPEGNRRRVA